MLPSGYILKDTYVVDAIHARGGMALVYRVHHKELGVTRALKILQPQFAHDAEFALRFRREAQIMAKVRHPNIAEVYDFGATNEGWLYLVMEWLEGEDLREVLKRTPCLPLDRIERLSRQISAALTVAHTAGIIHRDLKPSNVVLCQSSEGEQAKLVDFGVARMQGTDAPATLSGIVMGTPGYMAPEQLLGRVREIDVRSDEFSLAVMLYEMLLGTRLFVPGAHTVEEFYTLAQRIGRLELPPLPIENQAVRDRVAQVLRRALAASSADRFPSVAEFDAAFRNSLCDSRTTPSVNVELIPTQRQRFRQPKTQQPMMVGVLLASLLLLVAALFKVLQNGWPRLARNASSAAKLVPNERWLTTAVSAPSLRSVPTQAIGKPVVCRRATSLSIVISDDQALSEAKTRSLEISVKECLRSSKITITPGAEVQLERTNYLHVLTGLDIVDKDLLEHCLKTKNTVRPPRHIVIRRNVGEEGSCEGH